MKEKSDLLVVDTNLWISFLISKTYSQLDKVLKSGSARLLFSTELLDEFVNVAKRPKFKRIFSSEEIEVLLSNIYKYADFIEVTSAVHICRDYKDNFLLSLCKDGNADYLLTGDDDLLTIKQFDNTRIITLSKFLYK